MLQYWNPMVMMNRILCHTTVYLKHFKSNIIYRWNFYIYDMIHSFGAVATAATICWHLISTFGWTLCRMGAQNLFSESNKSRLDNLYGCKFYIQSKANECDEEEDGQELRKRHSRYDCRVHDDWRARIPTLFITIYIFLKFVFLVF